MVLRSPEVLEPAVHVGVQLGVLGCLSLVLRQS